jgi:hypothetical protein
MTQHTCAVWAAALQAQHQCHDVLCLAILTCINCCGWFLNSFNGFSVAGGLLRLQRVYGQKALGNNWAAGAPADKQHRKSAAAPAMAPSTAAFRRKILKSASHQRHEQQQQPNQDDWGASSSSSSSSSSSGTCKGARGKKSGKKPAAAFAQLQYNVYNLDDYQFV